MPKATWSRRGAGPRATLAGGATLRPAVASVAPSAQWGDALAAGRPPSPSPALLGVPPVHLGRPRRPNLRRSPPPGNPGPAADPTPQCRDGARGREPAYVRQRARASAVPPLRRRLRP